MREPKRQNVKRETPLSPDIIVRRCQEAVSDSLPALINHWVAATSLPRSTLQFQANVTQAIVLSVALLSDAPKRKRFSILRSEMSRVEKAASNAAKALRTLQSALDELTPLYRDALYSWPRFSKYLAERLSTSMLCQTTQTCMRRDLASTRAAHLKCWSSRCLWRALLMHLRN